MLSRGLSFFTEIPLSVAGMVIFMLAFAVVTLWTLCPRTTQSLYQTIAELPLLEDNEVSHE